MPPEVTKVLRDQKDTLGRVMKFQMLKEQKTWEYWQTLVYQIIMVLFFGITIRITWGSAILRDPFAVLWLGVAVIALIKYMQFIKKARNMRKELCPTKN